jgi:pyoverdine/dityrosine biosynthesis protein Dit1
VSEAKASGNTLLSTVVRSADVAGGDLSKNSAGELQRTDASRSVLAILYRYRRLSDPDLPESDDRTCLDCFQVRQERVDRFVRRDRPIEFVIPAFPAKSPNLAKVLGPLPDLGEYRALSFLQSLCDYIGHFHPPGARITICSDGHVFGDVVGVSDAAVTAYRECLADLITKANFRSLDVYGLDDVFGTMNYPVLRDILERDYSVPLEQLKENIRVDREARSLFNGIHRFMFEDAVAVRGGDISRTRLRADAKERAYHTIRRSNAWSRVVAEQFPEAVRLSIHPQPAHSAKFGLQLIRTRDNWLTPWHGVVLDDGVCELLVKRSEAEEAGATAVWRAGRPSHFVAPHLGTDSTKAVPA